jgi:hypothetical protein
MASSLRIDQGDVEVRVGFSVGVDELYVATASGYVLDSRYLEVQF